MVAPCELLSHRLALVHRGARARAEPEADCGPARGSRADIRCRWWTGLFFTDPVAGYPPSPSDHDQADRTGPVAPTRDGTLHNLCAIPIFAGIPIAALICATFDARAEEYRWASYSAGAAIAMTSATVLFGQAFGGAPRLVRHGGLMQRVSITTGFGWLSAMCLRGLTSALRG